MITNVQQCFQQNWDHEGGSKSILNSYSLLSAKIILQSKHVKKRIALSHLKLSLDPDITDYPALTYLHLSLRLLTILLLWNGLMFISPEKHVHYVFPFTVITSDSGWDNTLSLDYEDE